MEWGGELVLSVFVRFSISNGRLFCESSEFLLQPLAKRFHHVDGVHAGVRAKDVLALAGRTMLSTPLIWARSPGTFLRPFGRMRRHANVAKEVERDPLFDYGAPETVLERARSRVYSRYFQLLDTHTQMYSKILDRTILDAIVGVLDDHGIDTAELVERRDTIINNGINGSRRLGQGAEHRRRPRRAHRRSPPRHDERER